MNKEGATLLSAGASGGATGTTKTGLEGCNNLMVYIVATSVTTGATARIEYSPDGTNWVAEDIAITATGNSAVYFPGRIDQMKASLPAGSYTDGTYTVILSAN
jgi:hypothetical protein